MCEDGKPGKFDLITWETAPPQAPTWETDHPDRPPQAPRRPPDRPPHPRMPRSPTAYPETDTLSPRGSSTSMPCRARIRRPHAPPSSTSTTSAASEAASSSGSVP